MSVGPHAGDKATDQGIEDPRFRLLVDNLRDIVFLRARAADRVELYGADAQEITGAVRPDGTRDDALWLAAIDPADRDLYAMARDRRQRGERFVVEYRYVNPRTGRRQWFREVGWTVAGEPDGAGGIGMARDGYLLDITLEKQIETALLAAKHQAEEASRLKSEFLANVSHELRTPLNAIIGFSEILSQGLFGPLGNDRYDAYVRDIHDSGVHLLDVINDLLDLSKAEAGRLELDESVCDPAELAEACRRVLAERAEAAGVDLRTQVPDGLPMVRADARKLRQILINLLSNAVKFTPSGGSVTLALDGGPGGIAFEITDTGIGMAPDDVPKAMQPFRQIDASISRKYGGTGLGLPLVKALIDLHGGGLHFDTETGRGTRVTVELPPQRVVLRSSGPGG